MGHGGDVIAELTTDHREVDELFHQFEDAPPGSEARRRLADALTIELVRHSVAEEQYLYPAVRNHLQGGHSLADKALADHARLEHLLNDLQHHEPTDKDFDRLMARLRDGQTHGLTNLATSEEVVVDADIPFIPVGLDGEAVTLPTPVQCRIIPGTLRVRVPRHRPGVAPAERPPGRGTIRRAASAVGRTLHGRHTG
ncbi:hemerythrin domain-containing protein [Streptomyces decoyicus]|uniref:hemerythrin domain-containing protein n=1 Tax=Streptomyces decoyicus TaxID=249567 RepID=UPI003631F47C